MKPPYPFTGPYRDCYRKADECMDPRHVALLYHLLRCWPWRRVLELGGFLGASSTAFVEAIHAGAEFHATFCDVRPTESLERVLAHCRRPEQVLLTREPSWELLAGPQEWDLILVDANHDLGSVSRELQHLLPRQPLCVVAHDTSATRHGFPHCEGAALLKALFTYNPVYQCLEEAEPRPGELTHRGLFLATRDPALFWAAQRVFAAACAEDASALEMSLGNWPTALTGSARV